MSNGEESAFAMPLKYQSGEEIRAGDSILYAGNPGTIEFVVTERSGDTAVDWYIDEFGGGIMIHEPKLFGSLFLDITQIGDDEDLEFVSRT